MRETYDEWADTYDTVYSYVLEDIPFYVQRAREAGGPVLELACGTGRVTIPIAAEGIDIVGLDFSPAMLQIAERKSRGLAESAGHVSLIEADMRDFRLDQRFDLAIIPFRGFQALLTVEDQTAALARIQEHLNPGGRLVFNVFVPEPRTLVQDHDVPYHLRDVTNPETGARHVLYQQSLYDNFAQIVHARLIAEELDLEGTVVNKLYRDFSLRYSHRWEVFHLLESCNFEHLDLYGDFDGSEFDESSKEMIWVVRKP